ncbi:ABC transporter permease [uncultured Ornithinimicrobium sp.]|uniref:ABC transporter permease n=1 Tax=uncultured Ornithinimicrobium sp. TaxID=259307 RepID=UPI0025972550|nr:hypothetical protein [uncultured Ornithinimicrobium sp.]
MGTTTTRHRQDRAADPVLEDRPDRPTTGTGTLVRLMLRRDRIKLPAWVGGLGLFMVYLGAALPQLAPTEADLAAVTPMVQQPVGRLFTGPAYGMEDPTHASFFAAGYLLYLLLLAALMNIMLVTRHTRLEEQSGRSELVRADVVGRQAPLTAALVVAVVTNLLAAVVVGALAVANGWPVAGSVVVASAVALVGLAFAGITAAAAQLSAYSRGAAGLAGLVLGAAFALRALGDMVAVGGSALSWASPLGWAAQSAPYVLDRWAPLLLLLALAAATTVLAYALQGRRDLGAGLLPPRRGHERGGPSLGTPWGLALRLQRGPLLAWGSAAVFLGVIDGAFTQVMLDSADALPAEMQAMFGAEQMTLGYIAFLSVFSAMLAAAYVVYAVQSLRAEEAAGRAELVLATPTSRAAWAGAHLAVVALGATLIVLVTGVLTGAAATAVTGDASLTWDSTLAHLNLVPAVLAVLGLVALLHGWAPVLLAPVGWAMVGLVVFAGTFAALLDVPQAVVDLSPLSHPAQVPVEAVELTPLLVLLGLAALGVGLGLVGLRRREVAGRS